MDKLKNILIKLGRNLFFICILGVAGALTVYTIVQAVENSSSSSSTDSAENKLTSEEIDKIVEDLKISGNIDNILEKLDDIIYRAQLSGNSSLQEYATNMKTKYELQKQLDSVNGLLSSMKKKKSEIAKVDTQVTKILSVSTITEDLRGAVSDECLIILESLSEENVKNLQEIYSEIENIMDIKDVSSLSVQQRSLLDVLLLSKVIEDNMVEGEKFDLAKETLSVAITILKSYEKQNCYHQPGIWQRWTHHWKIGCAGTGYPLL